MCSPRGIMSNDVGSTSMTSAATGTSGAVAVGQGHAMSSENRTTKHSDAFDLLSRWVATLAQAPDLPFDAVVDIHVKIEAGDIAGAQHRILQEVRRQQQQHAAQQDAETT